MSARITGAWSMAEIIDPEAFAEGAQSAERVNAAVAKSRMIIELTSRWHPIGFAPKDGTAVLLFYPPSGSSQTGLMYGGVIEGDWFDGNDEPGTDPSFARSGWETVIGFIGEPTHWMPLPAPPATQSNPPKET